VLQQDPPWHSAAILVTAARALEFEASLIANMLVRHALAARWRSKHGCDEHPSGKLHPVNNRPVFSTKELFLRIATCQCARGKVFLAKSKPWSEQ
jgi:hypothetical protein